jgi:hypothetical protein
MGTTNTNLFAAVFGEFVAAPAAGVLGEGAIPGGCGWSAWQGGEGVGDEVMVAGAEEGRAEVVDQVIIPAGGIVPFLHLQSI